MTTARRTVRLIALLLRPWAIGVAVLGALAAAFPQSADGETGSAGGRLSFQRGDWPHPRNVVLDWTVRETPDGSTRWAEGGGWPDWGISWISEGTVPSELLWLAAPRGGRGRSAVRPAEASPDRVHIVTSLWYWLGLPALGSIATVWWWLGRGREQAEEGAPEGRPTTAWRLARPWLWAFAPAGALLLASGGDLWTERQSPIQFVQTRIGVLSSPPDAWSAAPDARPTRRLTVWHRRVEDRTGVMTRIERDWGSDAFGLRARRWRTPIVGYGWDAEGSGWSVSLSVWWLVGFAAAGNFVTLARLIRRRTRKAEP